MGNVSAGSVSADLVLNNKMGSVIASASAQLQGIETKMKAAGASISTSFDGALTKIKQMPNEVKYFGAALAVGVTAPLTAFGVNAVKTFASFDDSMRKVQATSGATGDDFQRLTNLAKELGASTSFSASQAADAMYYLALAGWDTNEILTATSGLLSLAAAAGMDLATAADIVSDTMSAYNMEASRANEAADIFAAAQSKSNTSVMQLGEAMKYAGAAANASSMDLAQTATILGIFADSGIKGTMAGTTFTSMLNDMKNKSKDGSLSIGNMNVALYDQQGVMRPLKDIMFDLLDATNGMTDAQRDQALGAIFGTQAMKGVNVVLATGKERYNELETAIYNSEGAAAKMQETMEGGLGGALRELNSAIESVSISIGGRLAVMLEPLVTFATKAAASFAALDPHLQDLVIVFGLVVAAIGPVILALAALPTIVAGVSGGLALLGTAATAVGSALFAIGIPIAAVVVALAILDRETGAVSYTWRLFKDLFIITVDGIMTAASILKDYIVEKMEDIKEAILGMFPEGFLEDVGRVLNGITSHFSNMGTDIHEKAEEISQDTTNIGTSTQDAGNQVGTATDGMQTDYANTGLASLAMGEQVGTATEQMTTGMNGAGSSAVDMAGNVNGAVPAVNALSGASYSGVTANQAYAASFVNVSNMASEAASAAISSVNRIGAAIKTNISQVGQLEAVAGKWNTRAKIGVTSSGGSGTGEGNVKVVDKTGQYAAPVTRSGGSGTGETNVKINTVNNYGTSASTTKVKSVS